MGGVGFYVLISDDDDPEWMRPPLSSHLPMEVEASTFTYLEKELALFLVSNSNKRKYSHIFFTS